MIVEQIPLENGEYAYVSMLECQGLKHTIPNACAYIKDSKIALCFYDFLSWQCVLAGIGTCEHRVQIKCV